MTNSQGKRPEQIKYSHVVIFFCCSCIFIMFIYSVIGLWWTLYLCAVGLCMMLIAGAGKLNKRYDDDFEKFHEDYQIDNGICEGECVINDKGELIYF